MDRHRGDRDRDWDRDHDRFGDDPDSQRHRRPSRFSDASPNNNFSQSPGNFRSGFSPGGAGPAGGHRSFDSPPGGGFRPVGPEGAGFRQASEGGFDGNFQPPLSGQKRGFHFSARAAASPENHERRNFVKLFVGSVPKTATEEDIRPLFEEHGTVIEVTLIKDKRTGQQQAIGPVMLTRCCFVKYATSDEANRAIQFLHNQCTLPGGIGPIQVRYADGERERLGNVEYKLFVGSLNKHATEKEVEEMFVPYGLVEDVYLMRDDRRQSRGCGFVKFSQRDSAMAAINALNGIYTMRGCDQPLIVRFADPKRPRAGESRGGPPNGSPGFTPIPVLGTRLPQGPTGGWQPTSPQNMGAFQSSGSHGMLGGTHVSQSAFSDSSVPGYAVPSSSVSPQFTPVAPGNYTQTQTNQTSGRQATQLHYSHARGHMPYSHGPPSQQLPGFSGQLPASRPNQAAIRANLQPNAGTAGVNAPQIPTSMSENQSPSQLAQMLAQQRQSLQASLQSSQQAFSQLQQQLQMRQPPNQNQQMQQNFQTAKQQPAQWGGVVPQAAETASGISQSNNIQPTRPTGPTAPSAGPPKYNWTEHVSPDGFKYYYNSVSGESRWTKPEELAMPDQQQQKLTAQHPQSQPSLNALPSKHVSQPQQPQSQTQFQHSDRLQQSSMPSLYQAPRSTGNQSVQGHHAAAAAAQEWMWKNKSGES
ncbi:hypothetical protein V2J09_006380 [Rumex salicifolius]